MSFKVVKSGCCCWSLCSLVCMCQCVATLD